MAELEAALEAVRLEPDRGGERGDGRPRARRTPGAGDRPARAADPVRRPADAGLGAPERRVFARRGRRARRAARSGGRGHRDAARGGGSGSRARSTRRERALRSARPNTPPRRCASQEVEQTADATRAAVLAASATLSALSQARDHAAAVRDRVAAERERLEVEARELEVRGRARSPRGARGRPGARCARRADCERAVDADAPPRTRRWLVCRVDRDRHSVALASRERELAGLQARLEIARGARGPPRDVR